MRIIERLRDRLAVLVGARRERTMDTRLNEEIRRRLSTRPLLTSLLSRVARHEGTV
jgi:hypothetical protein